MTALETLLYEIVEDAEALLDAKEDNMDFMQQEIGQLLLSSRENSARLKVVEFIDQKNLSRVLEIIIPFCQLISRRLPSIESEREVPPDMKEAIATLCFVGSKYKELEALVKVRSQFCSKYGEEYIVNLTKCNSDGCVNKKIRKLLLLPNPTKNERNKVLRKIAIKSNIKDWHPSYKWSRPEFKSSDWNFANKEWFSEVESWYSKNSWYNWENQHGNLSSTSTSPESMSHDGNLSSTSTSPESMSHNIMEIVPAGWNKV